MNITRPEKIVLLGSLSHHPVAGVAWQTIHYLVGFQRLGFDVYYVEAHGCTPNKLIRDETDDGAACAAAYIDDLLRRFGFEGRWAYRSPYESRSFGLSETRLSDLYRDAALIINLYGGHLPTPELIATNRLVYLGTDPVDIEIEVHQGNQETIDYLRPHCAFFTFGENLGQPDCRVPNPEPFKFFPTRQPVVMDFWEGCGVGEGEVFTTIGNWRQPHREVEFNGEIYRWSKHIEFLKFIDLPRRARQPFELALSSYDKEDKQMLEAEGWRVRHALDISQDIDAYRGYIGASRGEFTVAKEQNIRLRSGWFSDRAVTYLAAGRPVITQETGFSNHLPTGEGLFGFSTMEDIVAAVEAINADYERHRRAAWQIVRECFSHEVVLSKMLQDMGIPKVVGRAFRLPSSQQPSRLAARTPSATIAESVGDKDTATNSIGLPLSLVLAPTGRWPTRLPDETIQTALSLPTPVAERRSVIRSTTGDSEGSPALTAPQISGPRSNSASIIVVTYNGLLYTKMCLTSLLAHWHEGDELIVVDNASTDGTPDFLRDLARKNPFVKITLNEANRGFAVANNQGLAQATGGALILLNNDTILLPGWRDGLLRWLDDPGVGMAGPVTNRTCNEAQIDAPYRTCGELVQFAHQYTRAHHDEADAIPMLALFCMAMRCDVFERVGSLDEQFETGMFEDDDYALRVRQAGLKILCAENVFVHHFGQASLGELCLNGAYDHVLEANRARFDKKWNMKWQPHGRRLTAEYRELRERVRAVVTTRLPADAIVIVVSKGDEELLRFDAQPSIKGWHFPQAADGRYANLYPANSADAIAHLEDLRARGGDFLLIPKPALWWLEHYAEFKQHLEQRYRLAVRDEEICVIFALGNSHD